MQTAMRLLTLSPAQKDARRERYSSNVGHRMSQLLDIYGHIIADLQIGNILGFVLHLAMPGYGRAQ